MDQFFSLKSAIGEHFVALTNSKLQMFNHCIIKTEQEPIEKVSAKSNIFLLKSVWFVKEIGLFRKLISIHSNFYKLLGSYISKFQDFSVIFTIFT